MPVSNVPSPGSPIRSNWAQSVSNVANATESLAGRLAADSGWLALPAGAGFNAGVFYRRIGALVVLSVAVVRSAGNLSEVTQAICGADLPAGYRPSQTIFTVGITHTPKGVCSLNVNATGTITATFLTINTTGGLYGSLAYPIALP